MSWNIVCQPVSAEASPVGEYGVKLLLPPLLPPPVKIAQIELMATPRYSERSVACTPSDGTEHRCFFSWCRRRRFFSRHELSTCLERTSSSYIRSCPCDTRGASK